MDLGNERGPILAVTGTGLGTRMPAGGQIRPRRGVEKCSEDASLRALAPQAGLGAQLLTYTSTLRGAPRHRPAIARRLETDLPLLVMGLSNS